MGVEEVADEYRHAVAQFEIAAHGRAAQVEITIFHAYVVTAVGVVLYRERRCRALAEHVQGGGYDLDVARGDVFVLAFALADLAGHLYAVFASQLVSPVAEVGVDGVVEYQLRDAVAVAQVYKRHAAHLAAALNPSGQRYDAARVREAKLSTCVCSIHNYDIYI